MDELSRARALFKEGGYSCVILKDGEVLTSRESGVAPLIKFIESGKDFTGFCAADKIVGKAAALLYSHMGVSAVYAEVLSEGAAKVLKENGVAVEYGLMTKNIINRRGDGLCPMELAVAEIDEPYKAFETLKEKVRRL